MKDNRHEEVLIAKIKELEHDGFRVRRLDGKLADALAIKDNTLYAVEVLIAKWNEKRRKWEIPRSWKKHAIFDKIIKVIELENPCFPKEKARIEVARKPPLCQKKKPHGSKGKKSTIKVDEETKKLIAQFKVGRETYEEAILRLVRIAKRDGLVNA
jgi:hypothetical protein